MSKVLVLATRNPGKVREFQTLLGPLGYKVITAAQAGYDAEPEETGDTFRANAEIKARAVFEGTGGKYPVLSDDSGLAVDALGGAPGVWSARYAGPGCTDDDNNKKLLRELQAVTEPVEPPGFYDELNESYPDRTARYQIALCLIEPGREPVFFEAACEGLIGFEERGGGGFGYDVLFIPTGADGRPLDGRTFAEMSAEEKHPLSHRGKAVKALVEFLRFSV
ncbi:MAG: nucleoside-triphosphatase [Fibrobacteria bacterium]|jgi:XTP/dITP diphosphohydrolase|nr:nucleoside-triphosphatase [Fibrobacteria bacterium]